MTSSKGFAAALQRACDKRKGTMDELVKSVVIQVGARLVQATPVDTGRARANWQVGNGGPVFVRDSPVDRLPLGSLPGIRTLGRWRQQLEGEVAGGVVYITNALPYARRLEYGYSKQAPSGMVRVTAVEFASIVRDILSKLNAKT